MFYFISGELALLDQSFAVINAGGVGYKLTISGTTYSALPHGNLGAKPPEVKLYTYLSVREDGIELFGFSTLEEHNIFKLLTSVSGVGPKAAISLLTQLSPERVALAVCTEDKKQLSKAPGVGPKTAARIILELKDKLHTDNATATTTSLFSDIPNDTNTGSKLSESIDALVVLGFNRAAALDALKNIDTDALELEDIIKEALKKLMK